MCLGPSRPLPTKKDFIESMESEFELAKSIDAAIADFQNHGDIEKLKEAAYLLYREGGITKRLKLGWDYLIKNYE
jgi:hypothetical protein